MAAPKSPCAGVRLTLGCACCWEAGPASGVAAVAAAGGAGAGIAFPDGAAAAAAAVAAGVFEAAG
eukprot:CAMPEP_0202383322 /NCGR_PEP_ID=MMETSP1127-20130417/48434_1 /ASSEMBLY_ACC=CAM_ASM_000462 /TAXON_ID=3047 /ORGANISM="Dunaliella tertiolecta, Strain CCMP1320" /LENGTH=64 /DNA_ID=CAMNT_0048982777 /DNA_START=480 /DNA_END=674 /DNA_ORIENTATION=-